MMGGRTEPDTSDDQKYIDAIKSAIDHGIIHIDTAEIYGGGHTEELVAQAIKDYDRSKLFITTKLKGSTTGGYEAVIAACKASLERLQTDYIDLYLLHSYPSPGEPVVDIMRAIDDLLEQGLIKNIGVCNLTINRFETLQRMTKNKLVCNQVEYNLVAREAQQRGIVEYCQQNDVFLVSWGPLHKGILDKTDMLEDLAKKYQKTPYQVAINWVISQPNVITIPKTTTAEHLEENLGALGWELDAKDMQMLIDDYPNQEEVSSRVPLSYEADVAP